MRTRSWLSRPSTKTQSINLMWLKLIRHDISTKTRRSTTRQTSYGSKLMSASTLTLEMMRKRYVLRSVSITSEGEKHSLRGSACLIHKLCASVTLAICLALIKCCPKPPNTTSHQGTLRHSRWERAWNRRNKVSSMGHTGIRHLTPSIWSVYFSRRSSHNYCWMKQRRLFMSLTGASFPLTSTLPF